MSVRFQRGFQRGSHVYGIAPDGPLPKPLVGWQGLVRKSGESIGARQARSAQNAKRAGKRQPSMPAFRLPPVEDE